MNNLYDFRNHFNNILNDETINLIYSSNISKEEAQRILSELHQINTDLFDIITWIKNLAQNESLKKDNPILLVSEQCNKVFLPYTVEEINDYLTQFPDQYTSFEEVVNKEYILPLNYYIHHPSVARFREAYSLCRDREGKSVIESINYGKSVMFNKKLNPTIIAACKTQEQLSHYLDCLNNNTLGSFNDFEIRYELNPYAI